MYKIINLNSLIKQTFGSYPLIYRPKVAGSGSIWIGGYLEHPLAIERTLDEDSVRES